MRAYISEQVIIRRQPYFVPTPGAKQLESKAGEVNNVQDQAHDASGYGWWSEDWGAAENDTEMFFAGKGKKGKGKGGKGKGQFPGNCYHCDQPGHRLSQCPVLDAEMKGKGKGKGGYGKGKGKWGLW